MVNTEANDMRPTISGKNCRNGDSGGRVAALSGERGVGKRSVLTVDCAGEFIVIAWPYTWLIICFGSIMLRPPIGFCCADDSIGTVMLIDSSTYRTDTVALIKTLI